MAGLLFFTSPLGYTSGVEYVDIPRARITLPDKSVISPARIVYQDGRLAVWQPGRGRRNATRVQYFDSGVDLILEVAGAKWHKISFDSAPDNDWLVQQLNSGGCSCRYIAKGYTPQQLLEPDFASTVQ